jgi:hypothetical protein
MCEEYRVKQREVIDCPYRAQQPDRENWVHLWVHFRSNYPLIDA